MTFFLEAFTIKTVKKKIFLITLITLFFLIIRPVKAGIYNTPLVEELASPNLQLGSHTFTTVTKIIESLNTFLIGTNDENVNRRLGQSALETTSNLIATMYVNPPASSVEYFADLGKNLEIIKPAYAQEGIGFRGLIPILPLWKAFRNIAYLFFTIIFVFIGFAIMFQVKLNPQTVISVQNAIPRVIVALILVTFSYAIAGLLIDLIYVLISLGVLVIAPIGNLNIAEEQQKFMGLTFFEGIGLIFGGAWLTDYIGWLTAISTVIIAIVGGVLTGGPGALLGLLPILILAAIALWVILKLFFSLLKCYLNIILSIIFAPLQIMIGILPNAQMGFGAWIRNLTANIMVFPAVAVFLLLGWIIVQKEGPLWKPPLISLGGSHLVDLIGFGMLLMVHKVPDMVKESLKFKPFLYGTAIGESLKPISGPAGFLWGVTKEAGVKGAISYGGTRIQYGLGKLFGAPPTKETEKVTEKPPQG